MLYSSVVEYSMFSDTTDIWFNGVKQNI